MPKRRRGLRWQSPPTLWHGTELAGVAITAGLIAIVLPGIAALLAAAAPVIAAVAVRVLVIVIRAFAVAAGTRAVFIATGLRVAGTFATTFGALTSLCHTRFPFYGPRQCRRRARTRVSGCFSHNACRSGSTRTRRGQPLPISPCSTPSSAHRVCECAWFQSCTPIVDTGRRHVVNHANARSGRRGQDDGTAP